MKQTGGLEGQTGGFEVTEDGRTPPVVSRLRRLRDLNNDASKARRAFMAEAYRLAEEIDKLRAENARLRRRLREAKHTIATGLPAPKGVADEG